MPALAHASSKLARTSLRRFFPIIGLPPGAFAIVSPIQWLPKVTSRNARLHPTPSDKRLPVTVANNQQRASERGEDFFRHRSHLASEQSLKTLIPADDLMATFVGNDSFE